MKAFKSILVSEGKIVLRGLDTVIFGIGFPALVTFFIAIIMADKPAFAGADYSFLAQSFGALASISICATGLMTIPLTIADYRHRQILKRYRVTPVSPGLILAAHFLISFAVSLVSLAAVYGVSSLFFGYTMEGSFLHFILAFVLVALSIYSIGMLLASLCPNIKVANLVSSLVYFTMLFLSGAVIPFEILPDGMQKVVQFLPLAQGIKLLKTTALGLPIENVIPAIIAMAAIAVICSSISIKFFKWE